MKSFKTLLAAGSVALALVSQASADVTLRFTGSTALRAAAHLAMRDMLTTPIYKYSGSTLAGSTNTLFRGTISGQPGLGVVTIKCTWSGSTNGISVMANGTTTTVYYADATGATLAGAASQTGGITESGNAPDCIMMDNSQALTPFQANPITDERVGILPFVWVASRNAPAGLTNMTAQNARQLLATGYLSASAFTGNPADSPVNADGSNNPTGIVVYAAGRDNGSGTRTCALSETAYGANNLVVQLQPTASVRVTTNTSVVPPNNPMELAVNAADQAGISANMIGKRISGTGIPAGSTTFGGSNLAGGATTIASTTVTVTSTAGLAPGMAFSGTNIPADTTIASITNGTTLEIDKNATATTGSLTFTATPAVTNVTGPTIEISNAVTVNGSATVTIGNVSGGVATALYSCPDSGNGGQSSGGTLADQLRTVTNGASDPFGLQAAFNYSDQSCLVAYLGLSDADRAVNGTGSGISGGTNVGCRYLTYEGASCVGGAQKIYTIASQGAGVTTLTTATNPITDGVIVGQLMAGTGIAPGTTVTGLTASTITLSSVTTNVGTLTNNVVTATQFLPATTRSGQYSYWSYARIGYRTLTPDQTAVKSALVARITSSSTDLGAVSGLPDDADTRVTRSEVGQPISLKY